MRDTADRKRRGVMASRLLTIGIDIGGTKVAGGVVDADGRILARQRRDTPGKNPHDTEDTIADVVTALSADHDVAGVGIGAAGFVDANRSAVLFAPHLAWRHEPLRAGVERRLSLPVVVENDANASAWAEWRFGAAVGETHLLCVNLGTGIGGAVITNGVVQRGRFGIAGEFGHMTMVPGGHRCECGNRGCWEQYASGNALLREARELAAAGSPVAQSLLERAEGDVRAITGPVVTEAAKDGDPTAVELFDEIGRWLGSGLANLAAAFDPSCFVIGGGVSEAGELLLGPARETFRRSLTGRGFRPEPRIVEAQLGNDAGLIGAADLARESRSIIRRARRRMASKRLATRPAPSA
ncbi:MAG: ROK family glucokinase [Streptosporangiales bacterium]|nr:ROK family glucokinase [Streptosporangiales bacterium]